MPSVAPLTSSATPTAPAADLARAKVMVTSLALLLDRVRGSREVLPHLAALETALRQRGLASLDEASVPALSRMCSQLASLPVADDDAPLQDLQSRLLAAMDRRSRPRQQFVSSFMGNGKVVVEEISHSDFMAATQEDSDTVPSYFKSRDEAQGRSP